VAREIAGFVARALAHTTPSNDVAAAAFDVAVLAKVLAKLQGTEAELDAILRSLFAVAVGLPPDDDLVRDVAAAWKVVGNRLVAADERALPLPRVAAKLRRMDRRLRANGFVSFIE
jgi:hypothetical protein